MSGTGALPMVEAPLKFQLASGGRCGGNVLVHCAKCDAPAFIRRSERVTEKVKYLTCHCTNSGCGHVFKMELLFAHSIVEGNIKRDDLDLPVCPREDVVHVLPPRHGEPDPDQISMFQPDSG